MPFIILIQQMILVYQATKEKEVIEINAFYNFIFLFIYFLGKNSSLMLWVFVIIHFGAYNLYFLKFDRCNCAIMHSFKLNKFWYRVDILWGQMIHQRLVDHSCV